MIKYFQSTVHLHLSMLPEKNGKLEWLAIMQDYGTPTRLLDVTFSLHVATCFALESGTGLGIVL